MYCSSYSALRSQAADPSTSNPSNSTAGIAAHGAIARDANTRSASAPGRTILPDERNFAALTKFQHFQDILPRRLPANG